MTASPIVRVIQRLEDTVKEETIALSTRGGADLSAFSARKSQGLLELSRTLRPIDVQSADPETLAQLRSLRLELERNSVALARHMRAVEEVATIVAEAIRESESDGTYSPTAVSGGGRR